MTVEVNETFVFKRSRFVGSSCSFSPNTVESVHVYRILQDVLGISSHKMLMIDVYVEKPCEQMGPVDLKGKHLGFSKISCLSAGWKWFTGQTWTTSDFQPGGLPSVEEFSDRCHSGNFAALWRMAPRTMGGRQTASPWQTRMKDFGFATAMCSR